MGVDGLKAAARSGGIKGEGATDVALRQILQRNASTLTSGGQVRCRQIYF